MPLEPLVLSSIVLVGNIHSLLQNSHHEVLEQEVTSTLVISLSATLFSLAVGKEVAPVERNVWASLKDRLCKSLYTGGSCKKTVNVNSLFTLAVCIS